MKLQKTILRKVPLFNQLDDSELERVQACSKVASYPKGNILFFEGDPGSALLIILSGRVKVALLGDGGKEIILSVLREGEFCGVMSLLDSAPHTASAVTLSRVTLLQITRDEFLRLLTRHRDISMKILLQLTRWLRGADEQIRSLSMCDTYGRIVRALVRLARLNGAREDGRIIIEPRPSHRELARWTGCSRETVSRAMGLMRRNGYIIETRASLAVEERALKRYWAQS